MIRHRKLSFVSPYMLLGILFVLVPLFVFMTLDRVREHRQVGAGKMLEKGQALIRSFEAGTRAGLMNRQWGAARLQRLLTEVAFQPDILFMMITSYDGKILFHSDTAKVGTRYETMPEISTDIMNNEVSHRMIPLEEGQAIFEVYKKFTPDNPRGARHRQPMMNFRDLMPEHPMAVPDRSTDCLMSNGTLSPACADNYYIFAGLSFERVERVEKQFLNQMILKGLFFFLISLAGIIVLFAFQGYLSAKDRLKQVQAFSDKVIDHMPSGLITVDADQNITAMNQSARKILGSDLPALTPDLRALSDQAKKDGRTIQQEIPYSSSQGKTILLDVSVSLIKEDPEQISGYLFLFKDLTELARLKNEVETSRRMAAIGKLAAGVAHEIRNPLSSIKGFATYFRERYADIPRDRDTADIMVQEVERLNRSVTQLLEFARPMAVALKPVNIKERIMHAVKLVQPDLDFNHIRVALVFDTDELDMTTDPDRLNQVLLNLFLNSIQAMNKGDTLTINVGRDTEKDQVFIHVIDTGKGILAENIGRVFDPYFTTRNSGTGLGLAIVHRIIESLKGEIRIESEVDKGTTVLITIPGK